MSSTQAVLSVEITLSPEQVEYFGDSDVELVSYAWQFFIGIPHFCVVPSHLTLVWPSWYSE